MTFDPYLSQSVNPFQAARASMNWAQPTVVDDRVRLRAAAERGAFVVIRQSSLTQARESKGSPEMQRSQCVGQVLDLGVSHEVVTLLEALGEQASASAGRRLFTYLLQQIQANKVGLIVTSATHRLSRHVGDIEELLRLAKRHGVIFMMGTRLLDPANPDHEYELTTGSAEARRELRVAVSWRMKSRRSLARNLAARIPLPSGLVWADPHNREYLHALEKHGLRDWVRDLSRHREGSVLDARTLRILPFPDAEVSATVELRMKWLLELQDVQAVVARIREGELGWPKARRGLVPCTTGARWRPGQRMQWRKVNRQALRRWFMLPALYGIYAFYAEGLVHETLRADRAEQHKGAHLNRALEQGRPALPGVDDLLAGEMM